MSVSTELQRIPHVSANRAFTLENVLWGGLATLALSLTIGGLFRAAAGRANGMRAYALATIAAGVWDAERNTTRGAVMVIPGVLYFANEALSWVGGLLRNSPAAGLVNAAAGLLPVPVVGHAENAYSDAGNWSRAA